MKDLTLRLDALDPEAGTALRLIAYFDQLVEGSAGLHAVMRATAAWAGCPVGLHDPDRAIHVRVTPEGLSTSEVAEHASWPQGQVGDSRARLWIEREGPDRPLDGLLLERAAAVAAAVLRRTRGRAERRPQDAAWVEVAVDPEVSTYEREAALRRLRLPVAGLRPVAVLEQGMRITAAYPALTISSEARTGIGPTANAEDLPEAAHLARLALRLTAEGSGSDPGPRVLFADEAGGLLELASVVGPRSRKNRDVVALERAYLGTPWLLQTLWAYVEEPSVRAAAARLNLHHSTLQERLTHAEVMLGWGLRDTHGKLRVQLAIVLRRLHRGS